MYLKSPVKIDGLESTLLELRYKNYSWKVVRSLQLLVIPLCLYPNYVIKTMNAKKKRKEKPSKNHHNDLLISLVQSLHSCPSICLPK